MIAWYYVSSSSQRVGPISSAEMPGLVQQGVIGANTLIWREGMPQWTPYAALSGVQPAQPPAPQAAAPSPAAPASTSKVPAASLPSPLPAALSVAQSPFSNQQPETGHLPTQHAPSSKATVATLSKPKSTSVELTGVTITEANKARLVQEMLEGLDDIGKGWEYGGFWQRFLASFLDGVLCVLCILGATIVLRMLAGVLGSFGVILALIVQIGIPIAYWVFTTGSSSQATPGKRMLRLRVIRSNGDDVTYGTAFARMISQYASSICFMLGYVCAAFDSEKRTLHDRMCDTRIIRTS